MNAVCVARDDARERYDVSGSCGFLFGTRMRAVINFCEILKIEMGVYLGGGDAGVTEHFLHGAQVATGLQYM